MTQAGRVPRKDQAPLKNTMVLTAEGSEVGDVRNTGMEDLRNMALKSRKAYADYHTR